MRVAISQRVLPQYRVPVFKELAKRKDINITVFYGKGMSSGSSKNATHISGFNHKKLLTLGFHFTHKNIERYRVFHPFLWLHLIFGKYKVVIVEPSTNFLNNLLTIPLCKIFKKKIIWWEAGNAKTISRLRLKFDFLVKRMIKASDAYITYNSLADEYLQALGIPRKKIFRAQNTLDSGKIEKEISLYQNQVFQHRDQIGLQNKKVALYIGAIEKRKRIDDLIKAVEIVRDQGIDLVALIVGDGSYETEIKNALTKNQKEFVIFAGKQVEEAVLYILASDIVVLPGQGGLAVNHALLCGKPVIATRESDAINDYITNYVNGFIVEVASPNILAEKMIEIFTDKNFHRWLCAKALQSSSRFSLSRMIDGIESAINFVNESEDNLKT